MENSLHADMAGLRADVHATNRNVEATNRNIERIASALERALNDHEGRLRPIEVAVTEARAVARFVVWVCGLMSLGTLAALASVVVYVSKI